MALRKAFDWHKVVGIVFLIAISFFNCLAVYHLSLSTSLVDQHVIISLICFMTSMALNLGQSDLLTHVRFLSIQKQINSLKRKLAAAMKHSKTFEAFRVDFETRLQHVEQETERWPNMLNQTLTIFTLLIGFLIAVTQLGKAVAGLFHTAPAP